MLSKRYEDHFDTLKDVFKGIWSLGDYDQDDEVKNTVARAIENPKDYVIKPEKEGGGNNYLDDDAY